MATTRRTFTTALFIAATCASIASTADEDAHAAFIERTEAILADYAATGGYSGSALITLDGKTIHESSVGWAEIENEVPNTAGTRIRIGSINKHFTAALILQRVEAGELSLDDPLSKFELGFAESIADRITIRHLLNHTSGFGDIFTEEYIASYRSLRSISDKLALLIDAPLVSEPGEERHYSNYGYIVLGAILEKIDGRAFGDILRTNLLEPLELEDTVYDFTENVENKARSYHFGDDGTKVDRTSTLENVTPDGGMYSTPRDLARFYSQLLYGDTLLHDALRAALVTGFPSSPRRWDELLDRSDGHWASYGGGPGVSAAVEVLLQDRLIVVVLANTDGLVAERISERIVEAYRVTVRSEARADPEYPGPR